MIKEWSTAYPASQDNLAMAQPDLVNGVDETRVSQIHALRDKLDGAAREIGDASNLPSGCLRARVTVVETANEQAIHRNIASELSLLTEETTPGAADLVLLEKAAGGKRKVQIGNLPGGSDADAVHLSVASELSGLTEELTPTATDLVLLEKAAGGKRKVKVGNLPGGGGGGGADRMLVFSDDTLMTETGSTWVTKKTFRIVRDSDRPPTSWRAVVTIWTSGGASEVAECRLLASSDPLFASADGTSTSVTHTTDTETVKAFNVAITSGNEPVDTPLYMAIQLRRTGTGGSEVYLSYSDVFAVFA